MSLGASGGAYLDFDKARVVSFMTCPPSLILWSNYSGKLSRGPRRGVFEDNNEPTCGGQAAVHGLLGLPSDSQGPGTNKRT